MLTNRKTQLLGMALLIVAAALVTISAIRVPAPVDLSWPPRPDFSVLIVQGPASARFDTELSDYYERHRELNEAGNIADMSDYALRHREVNEAAGAVTDMSDYSLRHPELFQGTNAIDTSDYFLRH